MAELIGLRHKANQSLQHLSYGEQRLVLIARALIKQPPLLILDEALSGDWMTPAAIWCWLLLPDWQNSRKITLLYVTHHADEIPAAIQQRLLFRMQDGASRIEINGQ